MSWRWEIMRVVTFISGACLGCILAIFVYVADNDRCLRMHVHVQQQPIHLPPQSSVFLKKYDDWFSENRLRRKILTYDYLRYSNEPSINTESKWLYDTVPVLCVVLSSNDKYTAAVNSTWAPSCNKLLYYNYSAASNRKTRNVYKNNAKSSFHVLCDVIRNIHEKYVDIDWSIFVKDDMFVIPENLRYLVAPLNSSEKYYLGHAINFWGIDYNSAMAGFVLSKGAIQAFAQKFPDSKSCIAGGKYWKQEDLYLGKHLRSVHVHPADTRDKFGNTLFLGYDLDKVMFPNSLHRFANFYSRALYPVKCCSKRTITFQVLSSTEIYRYYYMTYTMGIFLHGNLGNKASSVAFSDDSVWQEFLKERNLPLNISSQEYENSWYSSFYNMSIFKNAFDKHFISKNKSSDDLKKYLNLTNMSEILADILVNYTSRKI